MKYTENDIKSDQHMSVFICENVRSWEPPLHAYITCHRTWIYALGGVSDMASFITTDEQLQ